MRYAATLFGMLDDEQIAFHEAAHVVLARAFGRRCNGAQIGAHADAPKAAGSSGLQLDQRLQYDDCVANIAIVSAGVIATGRRGFHAEPTRLDEIRGRHGGGKDWRDAWLYANTAHERRRMVAPAAIIREGFELGRKMVADLWPQIERVAAELAARGSLTAEQIDRLLSMP